ncbi:MAG: TonB-dependent receptor [Bacteroidota bacterium]
MIKRPTYLSLYQARWLSMVALLLTMTSPQLLAQVEGKGQIVGQVTDEAADNLALPFAHISLRHLTDSTLFFGAISNDSGYYELKDVPFGLYELTASFLAYEDWQMDSLLLSASTSKLQISIPLQSSSNVLSTVVVAGKKSLYEEKLDRLVYHADKDVANVGGTATDALRRMPMLQIDPNGTPSLKGQQNIQLLLNGKPSALLSGNPADALRQIPADAIKKIELITSPSARYDADGVNGIINIITKKQLLQNWTGQINTGVGNRGSHLFGSLGKSKKKWGLQGQIGSNWFYNETDGSADIQQRINGEFQSLTQQRFEGSVRGHFLTSQLSIDYQADERNHFQISSRLASRGLASQTSSWNNFALLQADSTIVFPGEQQRDIELNNRSLDADIHLDYTHQFKKIRQQLVVLAQYQHNNMDNRYFFDQFDQNQVLYRAYNDNPITMKAWTAQVDYQDPIKRKQLLEVGLKSTFRHTLNQQLNRFSEATPFPNTESQTVFQQQIWAAYASYDWTLNRNWRIKTGLRAEWTQNENTNSELDRPFREQFAQLFPNILIQRKLKNNQGLKFFYRQGIQRPAIFFLNANTVEADPAFIRAGNEALRPELNQHLESSYHYFFDKGAFGANLYYNRTKNWISTYSQLVDGAIFAQFDNIGLQQNLGLSTWMTLNLASSFSSNLSIDSYRTWIRPESEQIARQSGWVHQIKLNADYQINDDWTVQFFGNWSSPRILLQGDESAFTFHHLALRKNFKNNKGTCSLGIDNPFQGRLNWITQTRSPQFIQEDQTYLYNRGLRLSLSWRIGQPKSTNLQQRKRRRIQHDDLKEDQHPIHENKQWQ